jgi:hypothetical protein
VTVDQDGNLCPTGDDGDTASTDPLPDTQDSQSPLPQSSTAPQTNSTPSTPATTTAPATDEPSSAGWPSGRNGWTVLVMDELGSSSRGATIAAEVRAKGEDAAVIDTDAFVNLCPGKWAVFSGVFTTQQQAVQHQATIRALGWKSAYARELRSTGSEASCRSSARP